MRSDNVLCIRLCSYAKISRACCSHAPYIAIQLLQICRHAIPPTEVNYAGIIPTFCYLGNKDCYWKKPIKRVSTSLKKILCSDWSVKCWETYKLSNWPYPRSSPICDQLKTDIAQFAIGRMTAFFSRKFACWIAQMAINSPIWHPCSEGSRLQK